MKIVNRIAFFTYPSGTLFCKYEPSGDFGQLEIKLCSADKWANDFVSTEIHGWIKGCSNSDEYFDKTNRAEAGEAFMFDLESSSRDGLYDENQLFAVYDSNDLQALIDKLKQLQK
jgi:hypothetical protein